MHVGTILQRKAPTFSLEFFPPKTPDGWDRLFRVIRKFQALAPDFVSVTYGAGGATREQTHELVRRIATETVLTAVPHLTCVCHTRAEIDSILETVQARVSATLSAEGIDGRMIFHIYGKNGVMEELEPVKTVTGHELGLIIEGVGRNQAEADSVCSIARSTLLHYGYPGRISTAGNLAFPFSPSDIHGGEVYEFSIYHLMDTGGRPEELFPLRTEEIAGKETRV